MWQACTRRWAMDRDVNTGTNLAVENNVNKYQCFQHCVRHPKCVTVAFVNNRCFLKQRPFSASKYSSGILLGYCA